MQGLTLDTMPLELLVIMYNSFDDIDLLQMQSSHRQRNAALEACVSRAVRTHDMRAFCKLWEMAWCSLKIQIVKRFGQYQQTEGHDPEVVRIKETFFAAIFYHDYVEQNMLTMFGGQGTDSSLIDYASLAQTLLSLDAVRNIASNNQNQALRVALDMGHEDVALTLLDIPEVRDEANSWHNEALCHAVRSGCQKAFKRLIGIKCVLDSLGHDIPELIKLAAEFGRHEILEELLSLDIGKAAAAYSDNIGLRLAAKHGYVKIITALLEIPSVANFADAHGNNALRAAIMCSHEEAVAVLLSNERVRESLQVSIVPCLELAAQQPKLNILLMLLDIHDQCDPIRRFDRHFLMLAVKFGSPEMVDHLIKRPDVLEIAHLGDNEVLREACRCGKVEAVKKLLSLKLVRGNAHAIDNEALKVACYHGWTEVVSCLLEVASVYNRASIHANQALRSADQEGHGDIVDRLLTIPQVLRMVLQNKGGFSFRLVCKAEAAMDADQKMQELAQFVYYQHTYNQRTIETRMEDCVINKPSLK